MPISGKTNYSSKFHAVALFVSVKTVMCQLLRCRYKWKRQDCLVDRDGANYRGGAPRVCAASQRQGRGELLEENRQDRGDEQPRHGVIEDSSAPIRVQIAAQKRAEQRLCGDTSQGHK